MIERTARFAPAAILAALVSLSTSLGLAADPRIEFVLIQDAGSPINAARRWIDTLKRAGIRSVKVRGARSGEDLRVQKKGSESAPYYQVTAAITTRNTLKAPGVEFRMNDVTKIKNWVKRLQMDGLSGISGGRNAFGLAASQLLQVQKELSKPVAVSTASMSRADAIRAIGATIGARVDTSIPLPRRGEPLGEEMKGVATGSALAILLRPMGGALTIVRTSRGYSYVAIDSSKAKEAWPVGWPLAENLPRDAAPKLFQFTEDVDIRGVRLNKLIDALRPRLGSPVFYDHNALTALEIDPAEVRVTLPAGRSYYKRILDRALTQAKLKMDIRLDDNSKAFLWITTLRDPFRK